ncbi:MAG: membrane protein [Phycisphaerae bacterium]|jgi:xanthine/uracil permease
MKTLDTHEERSVTELIKQLRDESITLFRQEVALAKAEASEKVSRVGRNLAYLAVGGAVAYAGLIFLLLGVTFLVWVGLEAAGLEENLASWLSAMIVGVVIGAIGYGLIQKAISTLKHESVVPEKTVQSLQENKEWLKHKLT